MGRMNDKRARCERCATKVYKNCWWAIKLDYNTQTQCDRRDCWGCFECIKRRIDPATGDREYLCSDCLEEVTVGVGCGAGVGEQ